MCQGFTTREETTGYEGLHCEYRYIHRSRRTLSGYLLQKRSSSTSIHMEDHQKSNMFYHLLEETLQDGSIIQNVYRVHGAKYVECGVSTSFTSSTKD